MMEEYEKAFTVIDANLNAWLKITEEANKMPANIEALYEKLDWMDENVDALFEIALTLQVVSSEIMEQLFELRKVFLNSFLSKKESAPVAGAEERSKEAYNKWKDEIAGKGGNTAEIVAFYRSIGLTNYADTLERVIASYSVDTVASPTAEPLSDHPGMTLPNR